MIAFDVEDDNGELVGISFAWGEEPGQSAYWHKPDKHGLKYLFWQMRDEQFIAHNGQYDTKVLEKYLGYFVPVYLDTWIASVYLYPVSRYKAGELTLKSMAQKLLDVQPWGNASDLIKTWGSMSAVPEEIVSEYCRLDSVYTWKLASLFLPELRKQNLLRTVVLESEVYGVVSQMTKFGVLVDSELLGEITKKLDTDIPRLHQEMMEMAPRHFAINVPADVSSVLFNQPPIGIGLNTGNIQKTKSGFYSTAAPGLIELPPNPLKDAILGYRAVSDLRSKFVSSVLCTIGADNRIRSSWNSLGSITGRIISSSPNLQQVPGKKKTGKYVRNLFKASPGMKMVVADFSQMQLRILAGMASCKNMIAVFENNGDIHSSVAEQVPMLKGMADREEARKAAKAINFGLVFGMSAGGLCHYGFSYPEALQFYRQYFQQYPEIEKYHQYLNAYSKKGYVCSFYGRRIPCSPGSNTVKCLPIQATEADIVKIGMVRLDKAIHGRSEIGENIDYTAKLVLQIHDELVYEVDESYVDNFMQVVKFYLEGIPFPVPLKVDVSTGNNWGEAA